MCGSLRWEHIHDTREFVFSQCVLPPRTIAQVWKENGTDVSGWDPDLAKSFNDKLLTWQHEIVLCHLAISVRRQVNAAHIV